MLDSFNPGSGVPFCSGNASHHGGLMDTKGVVIIQAKTISKTLRSLDAKLYSITEEDLRKLHCFLEHVRDCNCYACRCLRHTGFKFPDIV